MRKRLTPLIVLILVSLLLIGYTIYAEKCISEENSISTESESVGNLISSSLNQSRKSGENDIQQVQDNATGLQNEFNPSAETVELWDIVPLDFEKGFYLFSNGTWKDENARRSARIIVAEGEKYKLSTQTKIVDLSGLIFFDTNGNVLSHYLDGSGSDIVISDYEFFIPKGAVSMTVQSTTYLNPPSLEKSYIHSVVVDRSKKNVEEQVLIESDVQKFEGSIKYGIRWEITNSDDLGSRCFDAQGLNATIGVGSKEGYSDFDRIYPWSEIKRCNIIKNGDGSETITFEGEKEFSLDGSNGDVFVRIPKFYYERYQKSGYEYCVVSEQGTSAHPAFIEDGKELDEIYIGAFEGYVDINGELRSIGGVMPTSNITAQEFLSAAQANGLNYSLYDNRCVDAIWALIAVEYGCRNTNKILGYGLANFEQPFQSTLRDRIIQSETQTNTVRTSKWSSAAKEYLPVGSNITVCDTEQINILTQAKLISCIDYDDYTEWVFEGKSIDVNTNCFIGSAAFNTNLCEDVAKGALSWHTGRTSWITGSVEDSRNPVRYRWIENIIGNLWAFLPDVSFYNFQMYVCNNMRDYVMHKYDAPYYPQGDPFIINENNGDKNDVIGANYWVTELDIGTAKMGVDFGRCYDLSLTSEKAFGAYYYLYDGNVSIVNGGGFDHLYRCNVLTQRGWVYPITKWYLYGARLMYKHLE